MLRGDPSDLLGHILAGALDPFHARDLHILLRNVFRFAGNLFVFLE